MSRTMRFIFWKTVEIGTMRIDMTVSCSFVGQLAQLAGGFGEVIVESADCSAGLDVTIDSVITISPMRSIRLSSFERFTLMRLCRTGACCCAFAAGALPGAAAFRSAACVSVEGSEMSL